MNISEAAKVSGVSAKMIRYYENIGLIKKVNRTESGYRSFTDNNIHTLKFIHNARNLGFKVKVIADLLALWEDRDRQSSDVKHLALEHIGLMEARIFEMQSMVNALKTLADHCTGDNKPECPILTGIEA